VQRGEKGAKREAEDKVADRGGQEPNPNATQVNSKAKRQP